MVNSLTRETGARLAPLLLETLVKHYFERLLKDRTSTEGSAITKLRRNELLYDETFIIVKTFLEAASKHPVEELQRFSNTRTPSPPWVRVVRLVVPLSCCDDAARIVIQALGGEEMTKKLVGGTKWWQVRGVKGVDAEWISAKRDWQENEKKYKAHQQRTKDRSSLNGRGRESVQADSPETSIDETEATYDPSMDEMRCILYCHGGGYYFGSVDQERYAIQRLARKINGRVFAMNYRLAPQYPFPCALQDAIACYLYLIRPPEGAAHRPVKPQHIVIAGDSAGGGLSIALLQVIRDCDLPAPAGAVLVSPWCDLTHSFPSIHTNTPTDVIPPYGLSFYKPSTLWPPPPDEIAATVRETLRTRIRQAIKLTTDTALDKEKDKPRQRSRSTHRSHSRSRPVSPLDAHGPHDLRIPSTGRTLHLGSTASLPTVMANSAGERDESIRCVSETGETFTITDQIHLYTPNHMLVHPLVSPVLSYLGGLPPLFVMAGNAEVLRDEVIYFAHKAANPEKYPILPETREMYPALQGIEERHGRPTTVHLQVYDDAAHVLPILFSFTTPAKYCFRAMALFIRQVTGMLTPSSSEIDIPITLSPPGSPPIDPAQDGQTASPDPGRLSRPQSKLRASSTSPSPSSREPSPLPRRSSLWRRGNANANAVEGPDGGASPRLSLKRALSAHRTSRSLFWGSTPTESPDGLPVSSDRPGTASLLAGVDEHVKAEGNVNVNGNGEHQRGASEDVGGPRFGGSGMHHEVGVRRAGEVEVYANGLTGMIRERVSMHGEIRPLEPEDDLAALRLHTDLIGRVSERVVRRYFDAKSRFDKKFASSYKTIEKHRRKHIERARKNATRNMLQLQSYIGVSGGDEPSQNAGRGREKDKGKGRTSGELRSVRDGVVASGSWSWAWALDMDEKPPPSSIVARRDTHEAVELARIADEAVLAEENALSGNNLWSLMINFLTVAPDKEKEKKHKLEGGKGVGESREEKRERARSRFAQIFADLKKHPEKASASPAELGEAEKVEGAKRSAEVGGSVAVPT